MGGFFVQVLFSEFCFWVTKVSLEGSEGLCLWQGTYALRDTCSLESDPDYLCWAPIACSLDLHFRGLCVEHLSSAETVLSDVPIQRLYLVTWSPPSCRLHDHAQIVIKFTLRELSYLPLPGGTLLTNCLFYLLIK